MVQNQRNGAPLDSGEVCTNHMYDSFIIRMNYNNPILPINMPIL